METHGDVFWISNCAGCSTELSWPNKIVLQPDRGCRIVKDSSVYIAHIWPIHPLLSLWPIMPQNVKLKGIVRLLLTNFWMLKYSSVRKTQQPNLIGVSNINSRLLGKIFTLAS